MTIKHTKESKLAVSYFRIEPQRFHYLKFILEGYDNLTQLSSLKEHTGVVRIKCTRDSLPELTRLLADLAPDIKRSCI